MSEQAKEALHLLGQGADASIAYSDADVAKQMKDNPGHIVVSVDDVRKELGKISEEVNSAGVVTNQTTEKLDERIESLVDKAEQTLISQIHKAEGEERFTLGVVMYPNDGVDGPLDPDSQKDIQSADEIKQAQRAFMRRQKVGDQHDSIFSKNDAVIVDSMIVPIDSDGIKGIVCSDGKKRDVISGSWIQGTEWSSKVWNRIKETKTGYSIGGEGSRIPVEE